MRDSAAMPPTTPPAIAPTGVEDSDCEDEGSDVGGELGTAADARSPSLGLVKETGRADADDAPDVKDVGAEEAETTVAGSVRFHVSTYPVPNYLLLFDLTYRHQP